MLVAVGILACGAVIKYVLGDILKSDVISIIGKAIHDDAKKALNESLNKEYNRVNINSFTISSDVVFLAAECCGVYGARDLFNHPNMRFNASGRLIRSPTFPPSCCKREYINKLDWTCCEDTTFDKVYTRGCYETIQDVVEGWYPWLIPTIVLSLAVQVGEIVVAALVCCDSDNFIV
nr:hypothetical protein BaRGS_010347 [Batillaria attramentaria]